MGSCESYGSVNVNMMRNLAVKARLTRGHAILMFLSEKFFLGFFRFEEC